ncbi:DUF892 family protein [Pedobacter xixiisoli]|uniref:Ferritin-like metal-binding protein YciE n=1 Tax=Pedobacter xixiisoli TaxID=1476464 RepID=A0A285ZVX4_9SPHI|nr:DUF892 family protein [Pedobacter xixiisoli]SOD13794.1 Ferritin-like metal-binding protein YciE [Pedobacter xixiisoli]
MNKTNNHDSQNINFDGDKLKAFFIEHLDKIYCAKVHLITRLPKLLEQAHFADLKSAILETIIHVENEISRMEMIYTVLDSNYSDCNAKGLTGLVEDAFEAMQKQGKDRELRDLSILFYLQNIESVEMASFQILQMAAVKLKNNQIVTLLKENYEEAKANRTLFLLIASKYITADPK